VSAVVAPDLARAVGAALRPLTGAPDDFDAVLAHVGAGRFALIGEASHGTHEFYRIRAEITKRLIREQGFTSVAVEADWPDAYRVNRYVRGGSRDADAVDALGGFQRFPQWMWRNADVLDFVGWLRAHNEALPPDARVGFYGLDLYALHASIEAVLAYLRIVDPEAALRAQRRYACFDHCGGDPQTYGYAASAGLAPSCETAVVEQLLELLRAAPDYARRNGRVQPDDLFYAQQNARLVQNAERYYRAMVGSRTASWNLRDRHMAETLNELIAFHEARGRREKVVVWAHNSHLGDARATELGASGELNVGQLVRQQYGRDAALIGFLTYQGTVTAASDWDEPAERKVVRPALPDSYEGVLHQVALREGRRNFLLDLAARDAAAELAEPRLERAIGVIYRPATERLSHYFHASLPRQFDAVLYYDTTRAVEPLERTGLWERGEVPETYPSSL
jgi:erythromycin esterase-like protein